MQNWAAPVIVDIPTFTDELGKLGVVESHDTFPFPIKRVYFLHDVPDGAVRGSHAHKELRQLIIAISGSFEVTLDDGKREQSFLLSDAQTGLTVPPGYWRTLTKFTPGSSALVLASEHFTPSDYIRDYDEFVRWSSER